MEQEKIYVILRDKALADSQRFVFPYVSTGRLNKQLLADWLMAFNRWLSFTSRAVVTERDYRRQFAAWFFHIDPAVDSPAKYDPTEPLSSADKRNVDMVVATGKTMPLPIIFPPEQPKGKFSTGDNRFDMYWLKNLRDEVRSMGV